MRTTAVSPRGLLRTEAARYVGVSPRTFDALVAKGEFKPIPVPGHRRSIYDVGDLDSGIERWKRCTTTTVETR